MPEDILSRILGMGNGIGVVGVIVALGWMVATGRLVPRLYYEREVHRADLNEETARISQEQVKTLLEKADTQTALLKSIQEHAFDTRKGGKG